jgi:heterodisulfide reductase subunit B
MKFAFFVGCLIPVKYPQFEAAIRKTVPPLGIELVDLKGFSCCPDPIYFKAYDKVMWAMVAARNLAIAEEAGLDIVTVCSGCTATLSEVKFLLEEKPELKKEVNQRLAKIGKKYEGTVTIRHLITVLRDDVGVETIKKSVRRPLSNLKVAVHYGCHLLKPSHIMRVDHPDDPKVLEQMIEALGAKPVRHREFLLCCGKACIDKYTPAEMTFDVLSSIEDSHADCMGLICPSCFDSYDLGQIRLGQRFDKEFNIPVIFYFQLLGLAQGLSPKEVGLDRNKVKAEELFAR